MKKGTFILCAAALIVLPAAVSAQAIGIGARIGTLGIGAEAAVGLGSRLALRGGVGLTPIETDASRFWDVGDDVDATFKLPKTWYNIGADLYLGGGLRVGGGMLFKPDDPTITGTLTTTGSIQIGDSTYYGTAVSEITGAVDSKTQAPYVLIGFGKEAAPGIGLFLDLGVAFLGEPVVTLTATGDPVVTNSPEFKSQLVAEQQKLDDDLPTWAKKYWPILNIGIKVGIGG